MLLPKCSFFQAWTLILASSFMLGLSACTSGEALPEEDILNSFLTPNSDFIDDCFFHAWLADCTADTTVIAEGLAPHDSAKKILTARGTSRITNAFKDTTIQNHYGFLGKELVWGPALRVDTSIFKSTGNLYLTYNLIYVLYNPESGPENDFATYSVGVSGTNMISGYDWFKEDFNVETTKALEINGQDYGNISEGAHNGYQVLMNLKDPTSGKTIGEFFDEAIKNPDSTLVTVSGHSLGGALAPVVALDIKAHHPKAKVATLTFAGPTTGDKNFVDKVNAGLDLYLAFQNKFDVVPHVWQKDSLNKLCDLYPGTGFCPKNANNPPAYTSPIEKTGGPLVDGLITYFRMKSAAGNYQEAGQVHRFTGALPNLKTDSSTCSNLFIAATNFYAFNAPDPGKDNGTLTWYQIDTLLTICKKPETSKSQALEGFFAYVFQLAGQHTTAYLNHFIPPGRLQDAVNKYVPAQDDLGEISDIGFALSISERLFHNAFEYLKKHKASIESCACPKKKK